jgi:predicted transcriptional regulator
METIPPSSLELQALAVLWANGRATVREVRSDWADGKDRLHRTVTILQKMERDGVVRRAVANRECRSRRRIPGRLMGELITERVARQSRRIDHTYSHRGRVDCGGKKLLSLRACAACCGRRDQGARQQTKNKTLKPNT